MTRKPEWVFVGLAAALVVAVIAGVDLSPRVESDFFFSEDDPQLRATVEITERFPSPEQLIVRAAASDLESDAYRATVREMTKVLADLPGVIGVFSVTKDDPRSPLWGRLLLNADGRSTNLVVQVDDTDPAELVPAIEEVIDRFDGAGVDLDVSGVPWVMELIRRYLYRDFITFSVAALLVFGVTVQIVYRRWGVVLGTLVASLTACALTVSTTHLIGMRIGLLTANIVTIVFVLTLSHIVFLTSNWTRIRGRGADDGAVSTAMRETFRASIWCMVTTFSGFLSLLLASARPLRDLGLAGAIGTVIALIVAYSVYPVFLWGMGPTPEDADESGEARVGGRWSDIGALLPVRHRGAWLVGIGCVVLALAPGVWLVETDPPLVSYFGAGSELREGLELIDRDGGSSPLYLVVRDSAGRRVDTDEVVDEMWALQEALESDPSVGVVLSPVLLLAEARRQPLAGLLGWSQLLDILETPFFSGIVRSFISEDRLEGLFFVRMREVGRTESRADAVTRMRDHAREHGLDVVMVGGAYELQGQLGRLIARSLRFGLGGLLLLFVGIAFVVSRRPGWTVAMIAVLTGIPVVVLGGLGYLRLPVDIITSPAANVALAMGVDSMIHLVTRVRRMREAGSPAREAWLTARAQLWRPILGATLIICAGFGIFSLSAFPPTQRFGIAVILGTLTAAMMTLVALPFAAGWKDGMSDGRMEGWKDGIGGWKDGVVE